METIPCYKLRNMFGLDRYEINYSPVARKNLTDAQVQPSLTPSPSFTPRFCADAQRLDTRPGGQPPSVMR